MKRQRAAISGLGKLIEVTREPIYTSVHPEAFPRLVISRGALDEAISMTHEAIAHCELLVEEGLHVPVARSLTEHKADPLLGRCVWVCAGVDKYFPP